MNNKSFKIIIMVTIIIFLIINISSAESFSGSESKENYSLADVQRNALIETAEAYFRQGKQLQYDSYRKNLLSTPEDATSQHYCYTVCSGFTYQVYKQTLGIDIPDTTQTLIEYAKANKNNKETVIALYEGKDYVYSTSVLGTLENPTHKNLVEEWINIIKPGDVIVVTGHAFMVKSVNKTTKEATIMESALGKRYSYLEHKENYDEEGTIRNYDLYTRMRTYYNYLKNGKNEIEDIAIIRFITDGENYIAKDGNKKTYTLTPAAKSRIQYKKIDIEKTLQIKSSEEVFEQSVLTNLGETITYTVTITNNNNSDYKNIVLEENIDSKVTVTDKGGGTLSNNKLKWTISSIAPGTTVTKKYTVKVKNIESNLNKIIISTGRVDNIATSKIETLIGNRLDKEEKTKLVSAFNKNNDNSLTEKDFIRNVYKDAFGIDIYINNNMKNDDIMTYDTTVPAGGKSTLSVNKTKIINDNIKKLIYNNFYGMEIGEKGIASKNIVRSILQWNIYTEVELYDRARTITKDMLYDGDIILVKTYNIDPNGEEKSYIYLNNKLHRKIAKKGYETVPESELNTFLGNMVGQNYMILRPSIILDEEIKKLEESTLTPEPTPTPTPTPKPTPAPTPQPDTTVETDEIEKPSDSDSLDKLVAGEEGLTDDEINDMITPSDDETDESNDAIEKDGKDNKEKLLDIILVIVFVVIAIPVGIYVYKSQKKHLESE